MYAKQIANLQIFNFQCTVDILLHQFRPLRVVHELGGVLDDVFQPEGDVVRQLLGGVIR